MTDFYDVLAQVITLLHREGRTSYRALKRQFGLDDDYIEDVKEELIEAQGVVHEILPDSRFRVTLDNGHELIAYTAGKMRRYRIRVNPGDRIKVELSPYDLNRGRIVYRFK